MGFDFKTYDWRNPTAASNTNVSGAKPPSSAANGTPPATSSDWWTGFGDKAIDMGVALYQQRNSKPRFTTAPVTPEQKAINDLYLRSLMDPNLLNNGAIANQRNEQVRANYNNIGWTAPTLGTNGLPVASAPQSAQSPVAAPPTAGAPVAPQGITPFRTPEVERQERLATVRQNRMDPTRIEEREMNAARNFADPIGRDIFRGTGNGGVMGSRDPIAENMARIAADRREAGRTANDPASNPNQSLENVTVRDDDPTNAPQHRPPDTNALRGWFSSMDARWDQFRSDHPVWAWIAAKVAGGGAAMLNPIAGLGVSGVIQMMNRENSSAGNRNGGQP